MDNMYQLKQDTTNEQLNQFAQDRLQRQQMTEEYLEKREIAVMMTSKQLTSRYEQPPLTMEKVSDMPALPEDEKESKKKKRKKNLLKKQVKELEKRKREGNGNPVVNFFEQTIRADMLTPKYVMENYATIRLQLDSWKKQLGGYDANPGSVQALSREQQLKLDPMWKMYMNAELAFRSALGALGITYNEKASADKMFEVNLSEEEKAKHLEHNRTIREKIEKTSIDEMVADKLIEESAKRLEPDFESYRKDMKKNERFGFIESKHMTHDYQYEEIAKIKELLETHSTEYAQNKKQIDLLYQELYHLMEVNGDLKVPSMAIGAIQFDNKQVSSNNVGKLLERRRTELERKMTMILHRTDCIRAGIKHLILGTNLTEVESLIVGEYVNLNDAHAQERKAAVAPAADYADRYRDKQAILESLAESKYGEQAQKIINSNNRFMMMMEPGQHAYNEEVLRTLVLTKQHKEKLAAEASEQQRLKAAGQIVQKKEPERSPEMERAVKNLVVPYMERMRDFDTSLLQNGTDEELLAKLGELQELSLFGMHMTDLGKYQDPDDPNGGSIKDNFCGEDKEIFELKCSTVQAYAFKARAISMIKAYDQGALVPECLTEKELEKVMAKHSLEDRKQVTPELLLSFAKDMLRLSASLQDTAYNRYYKSEKVLMKYAGIGPNDLRVEFAHEEFINRVQSSDDLVKEKMGLEKAPSFENIAEYYRQCEDQVEELKKKLETADEKEAKELQTELKNLQSEMELLEVRAALTKRRYKKVSDEKSDIKEEFFRSYDVVESLPSFRKMTEAEFATMCKQLSAGALRRDADDPERKAAYLEENRKGLATYKVHMREHYEMLEERFHHQVPSIEYIEEHYFELKGLFASIQVDCHLAERDPEFLDLTKEEDVRLNQLVHIYFAIGSFVSMFSNAAALDSEENYMTTYRDMYIGIVRGAQWAFDGIEA